MSLLFFKLSISINLSILSFGSAMDNKIYSEMKAYSEESGIPISKMLDSAMTMYLESTKKL